MGVAKTIWKRTTPFSKHCQFVMSIDNEKNKIEVCEEEADFGVYMAFELRAMVTDMKSPLFQFHFVYITRYTKRAFGLEGGLNEVDKR